MPEKEPAQSGDMDDADDLGELGELAQAPAGLFDQIMFWLPVALFGLSMAFLGLTVIYNPAGRHERPREPEYYFAQATEAFRSTRDLTRPLDRIELERAYSIARVNLTRMIRHYAGLISQTTRFGNPYLLLAEANRELAAITPPTDFRNTLLTDARTACWRAQQLEDLRRTPEAQAEWDTQFITRRGTPAQNREEVALRRERRRRYIAYHQALLETEMGNPPSAVLQLLELQQVFSRAEEERLRNEREGTMLHDPDERLPFREYELLPADRLLTDYHLARAYELSGMADEAERRYRIFLLRAPAGRERFLAQMRLASMIFREATAIRHFVSMGGDALTGRTLDDARKGYEEAAAIYAGVVEASPPESIRDEAYFRGGQSYLLQAAMMETGSLTWWDATAGAAQAARGGLSAFSGLPLPERTALFPSASAATLLDGAAADPFSLFAPARLAAGGILSLATSRRVTPQERRNQLLARARAFFDGASRSDTGRFTPEAQVMIGKSLLIGGRIAEARQTLNIALRRYAAREVRIGANQGIAESYLAEGHYDEAWEFFRDLPAQDLLPDTPLVGAEEIAENLQRLGHAYLDRANALHVPDSWPESQEQRIELRRRMEERQSLLSRAAEVHTLLLANYRPQMRDELLINLAHLYEQQADDLLRPPFGFAADLSRARELRAQAARTYFRITTETPGSSRNAEALLSAGRLFAEAQHHERAVECLQDFCTLHINSEQIGLARNILGLSFRQLGLYDDAIRVFRQNGYDSNTAEGRKSLYFLGETLMERGGEYLGGPGSELNHPLMPQEQRDPAYFRPDDIRNWTHFLARVRSESGAARPSPGLRIWEHLSTRGQELVGALTPEAPVENRTVYILLRELNRILALPNFYSEEAWTGIDLDEATRELRRQYLARLKEASPDAPVRDVTRFNRLLLMAAYPNDISGRDPDTIPEDESMRVPQTAREVFEYVRSLPGLSPDSHPWRWSTFALGDTHVRIATMLERGQRTGEAAAATHPEAYYRRAAEVLTEALDRYPLAPLAAWGLPRDESPEDYDDIRRATFIALYQRGISHAALGLETSAQADFAALIDENRFDEEFLAREELPLPRLRMMHEQSFLLLGLSCFRTRDYERSLQAFSQAHDRLKNADTPYTIHMMGECHFALGNMLDARRMFVMADNASRNMPPEPPNSFAAAFGNAFWRDINTQRLRDLEYRRETTARMPPDE